ncbi:MAG: hypothetical protein P9X22_00945 [Candidatus Zapsychrus exili]|nr:hypothetical protein [Candidatus Zapsychrus exili]
MNSATKKVIIKAFKIALVVAIVYLYLESIEIVTSLQHYLP